MPGLVLELMEKCIEEMDEDGPEVWSRKRVGAKGKALRHEGRQNRLELCMSFLIRILT